HVALLGGRGGGDVQSAGNGDRGRRGDGAAGGPALLGDGHGPGTRTTACVGEVDRTGGARSRLELPEREVGRGREEQRVVCGRNLDQPATFARRRQLGRGGRHRLSGRDERRLDLRDRPVGVPLEEQSDRA